jgi:hypothetical protein
MPRLQIINRGRVGGSANARPRQRKKEKYAFSIDQHVYPDRSEKIWFAYGTHIHNGSVAETSLLSFAELVS